MVRRYFIWANEDIVGNVTLIQRQDGSVTGTIDVEGTFYEIRSLGSSGLHAVRQSDMSYVKEVSRKSDVNSDEYKGEARPDSSKTKKQESTGSATIQQYRCSPEYHRLLVLNTQAAAQGRDIDGIASLAIQETNESYNNSQVNDLRIAEAHQQQINFNETQDIDTDLNNLLTNANVQNLRNQHNADAVILLTDGNYTDSQGRIISGSSVEILATESTAYAIVEAEYATGPDYTFPHELGHIQGAQHHPDDGTEEPGPFSYGYGHRFSYKGSIFVPRRYRSTIMAYECRPFNQDPLCETPYYTQKYFSNPDVEYQDVDTGIPGERENWQVLENTAIEVADFRDENELRTGYSQSGNPSTGQYTLTAQPCGGQSGYSYEWRVSYDNPYNYGGVVGTNQSLSWTFPTGQHFARVRVTSGASQEAFATAQVYVTGGSCPPGQICLNKLAASEKTASGFEEEIPDEVQLNPTYPNPFNPNTVISGLKVSMGDLLHGDVNGLLKIPIEIAARIPEQVDEVRAREGEIIDFVQSSRFSIERLKELQEKFRH